MTAAQAAIDAKLRQKQLLLERAAHVARTNFYAYVRALAPLIVPNFVDGKHLRLICDKIQAVVEGDGGRLMIFLPPGSMKSKITSVLLPTWVLGRDVDYRVIGVSHGVDLAEGFGYEARNLLETPEYRQIFPNVQVSSDRRAAKRWQLAGAMGTYLGVGVGTNLAGFRADLAILDDVLSEQTAFSRLERDRVNDWYGSGLSTRLLPGGRVIIVNTRWHVEDLSGYLLQSQARDDRAEKWEVLSIPALLDKPAAELLGLPEGTSYWPELWPTEELLRKRDALTAREGARHWSALYMQRPTLEGGNIFKEDWFQTWEADDPPQCQLVIQTLDTAYSLNEDASDSVIQTWGVFIKKVPKDEGPPEEIAALILLDQRAGKYEYHRLRELAKERYEKWKPSRIIVEKKASGQSLIQDLQRAHLPVQPYMPDRDKESRAHVASGLVEAGRVWLPPGDRFKWARLLKEQATLFTGARHERNDMVDAMVMAILWVQENYQVRNPRDVRKGRSAEAARAPKPMTYWSALTPQPKPW